MVTLADARSCPGGQNKWRSTTSLTTPNQDIHRKPVATDIAGDSPSEHARYRMPYLSAENNLTSETSSTNSYGLARSSAPSGIP